MSDQEPEEAPEDDGLRVAQEQAQDIGRKLAEIAESNNRASPPDSMKLDFKIGDNAFSVRLNQDKKILLVTPMPHAALTIEEFDTLIQTLDHAASMVEPAGHARLMELTEGFAKSIGKGIVSGTDPDADAPWKKKT